MKRASRGFTLLEMLVASTIMGIAVVALLSQLSVSLRNQSRIVEYDRATLLARHKLDELLTDFHAPRLAPISGTFPESVTGGVAAGWRARIEPFEMLPNAAPGSDILERVQVEVWWGKEDQEEQRHTISLEGFRHAILPQEAPAQ